MSDITERTKVVNTENLLNQVGILKNALKMAFGTIFSRILGLFREVLLAALFDKSVTDAWNAAFRLPNLFRRVLGEGAISASFVPVFIETQANDRNKAQNLVSAVYTIFLFVLVMVTTLGVLKPHWILHVFLDASYIQNAEKYLMTQRMSQIMFGFVFFVSSFAYFASILNALGRFFLPAIAPTFLNITMVISTVWPKGWLSEEANKYSDQLAWGVFIGGVLQFVCLIPSLKKAGYLPSITFKWNTVGVKKIFKNLFPGMLGIGLFQITSIVNLKFASSLTEGTISYIHYVDRLIELPLSLISVSLGTALLPMLSHLWVQNKKEEMSRRAQYYLQLNLFISITTACGAYVLAEPIIRLLFGRGLFNSQDVIATALILKSYCWILIFYSGVRVMTPIYFATKNTWLPSLASLGSLIVHIILAPFLINLYGLQGLMVSTIISASLNFFGLLLLCKIMIFNFNYREFVINVLIYSVFGVAIIGFANMYFVFLKYIPSLSSLVLTFILVLFVFLIMAAWLFPLEVDRIKQKIKGKKYV